MYFLELDLYFLILKENRDNKNKNGTKKIGNNSKKLTIIYLLILFV